MINYPSFRYIKRINLTMKKSKKFVESSLPFLRWRLKSLHVRLLFQSIKIFLWLLFRLYKYIELFTVVNYKSVSVIVYQRTRIPFYNGKLLSIVTPYNYEMSFDLHSSSTVTVFLFFTFEIPFDNTNKKSRFYGYKYLQSPSYWTKTFFHHGVASILWSVHCIALHKYIVFVQEYSSTQILKKNRTHYRYLRAYIFYS